MAGGGQTDKTGRQAGASACVGMGRDRRTAVAGRQQGDRETGRQQGDSPQTGRQTERRRAADGGGAGDAGGGGARRRASTLPWFGHGCALALARSRCAARHGDRGQRGHRGQRGLWSGLVWSGWPQLSRRSTLENPRSRRRSSGFFFALDCESSGPLQRFWRYASQVQIWTSQSCGAGPHIQKAVYAAWHRPPTLWSAHRPLTFTAYYQLREAEKTRTPFPLSRQPWRTNTSTLTGPSTP